MHFASKLLLPAALALTIVPGLKTIAKAQHPAPTPAEIPLSLPRCARPAQSKLVSAIGCQLADAECICAKKKNFLPRLLGATAHVCSSSDQEAVKQFGAAYCGLDPKKVTTLPTAAPTEKHAPAVIHKCTPTGTDRGSAATRSTVLTVSEKTSTSTKKPKTTKTNTTTTKHDQQTNVSSAGMIANAGVRLETGMSVVALIGAIMGMGWVFAEF